MQISKVMLVLLVALFMNGCGDQAWCGDDGCNASSGKISPKK